ncbi:muscarinic acetylcholine receptor M5-like [Aplysia californica]|uniref:Muscarinic acetylcholine receptor M5-like n=1 Tax=Aplysia californica TaxID=6500 RepID=A0ABM0JUR0_APLCA|nr:muscarinic acetylcholine receptor M5-like [Aplysia californica]
MLKPYILDDCNSSTPSSYYQQRFFFEVLLAQINDSRTTRPVMNNVTTEPRVSITTQFPLSLGVSSSELVRMGYYETLCLAILLVTIIITTIVTNFIVVVVFVTRENRKRSKNIYLANLSLVDLIIGLTIMPVSMLSLLNKNWHLPSVECRIHLISLHSLVFASLLAVMLVSIDRWYSICYPFTYRVRPTGRIALYAVVASWLFSFAIHLPLVGAWDLIAGGTWVELQQGICQSPSLQHPAMVFTLTLLKYLTPHLSMLLLKCSLYKKIKQRKTVNVRRSISSVDTAAFCLIRASMSETAMNALAEAAENIHNGPRVRIVCPPPIERRNTMDLLPVQPSSRTSRSGQSRSWSGSPDQRPSLPLDPPTLKRRMSLQDCLLSYNKRGSKRYFSNAFNPDGTLDNRRATIGDLAKNLLDKQDSKAAWYLSLLLASSMICWTPWSLFSLVSAFLQLPTWVNDLALWILLGNSTANPFLYGLLNKDFRRVVASWLRLRGSKKKRLKTALRMLSWQMAWGTTDLQAGDRTPEQRSSLTPCQEGEEC